MATLYQVLSIGATAFVVGLSGAMMPGPMLAVTITEAGRRGAAAGPLIVLGHMFLESILVAAVALGVAGFLKHPVVISVISFVGGAVLCWMGQGMFRSARGARLRLDAGSKRRMNPVAAGVVVSLSNPYWTIWWATIGMTYIVLGLQFGFVGILSFFIGHICSDFAWFGLVSVSVARGKALISDRAYSRIIALCGVVLVAFGLWFFHTGVRTLVE